MLLLFIVVAPCRECHCSRMGETVTRSRALQLVSSQQTVTGKIPCDISLVRILHCRKTGDGCDDEPIDS